MSTATASTATASPATASPATTTQVGARVYDVDQVPIGTVTQVQKGRLRVRSLLRDFWLDSEHVSAADGAGVWLSVPEIVLAAELPPPSRTARSRSHRKVAA